MSLDSPQEWNENPADQILESNVVVGLAQETPQEGTGDRNVDPNCRGECEIHDLERGNVS